MLNADFALLLPKINILLLTPDEAASLILLTSLFLGSIIKWLNTPDEETQKKIDEEIDKQIDEEIRKAKEAYERDYLGKGSVKQK